ncbi:hypothetical protein TWF694_005262 [Orbilia ellipsospora]|uniref:Uncharacterized protein n=1 Tax=Orbilia ellipsospora TaxID=2528407 RepID=A0AAV9WTN8_9PEZI
MSQVSSQATSQPTKPTMDLHKVQSLDLEKSRTSSDSDESTIRIPFSEKRTSRKLFFTLLILANFLIFALVIGLSVGLALRYHNSSKPGSSSSSSSDVGSDQTPTHNVGGGPDRHS